MLVIGLTGQIGTGKSTLGKLLKEKGAVVIDSDKIGHEVLKDPIIKEHIKKVFGDVLTNGEIDRQKLAQKAFSSKENLEELNRIMWLPIVKVIDEKLDEYSKTLAPDAIVVIEAPLLLEAGLGKKIQLLVVVTSSPEIQLERLVEKGYSKSQAQARIKMQTPKKKLIDKSDYTILNNDSLELLKKESELLWHFLKQQSAS